MTWRAVSLGLVLVLANLFVDVRCARSATSAVLSDLFVSPVAGPVAVFRIDDRGRLWSGVAGEEVPKSGWIIRRFAFQPSALLLQDSQGRWLQLKPRNSIELGVADAKTYKTGPPWNALLPADAFVPTETFSETMKECRALLMPIFEIDPDPNEFRSLVRPAPRTADWYCGIALEHLYGQSGGVLRYAEAQESAAAALRLSPESKVAALIEYVARERPYGKGGSSKQCNLAELIVSRPPQEYVAFVGLAGRHFPGEEVIPWADVVSVYELGVRDRLPGAADGRICEELKSVLETRAKDYYAELLTFEVHPVTSEERQLLFIAKSLEIPVEARVRGIVKMRHEARSREPQIGGGTEPPLTSNEVALKAMATSALNEWVRQSNGPPSVSRDFARETVQRLLQNYRAHENRAVRQVAVEWDANH